MNGGEPNGFEGSGCLLEWTEGPWTGSRRIVRFSDRIERSSFTEDETVGFAAIERDIPMEDVPEAEWVFVPRGLFDRLLHLGRAYALHFASLLEGEADTELNSTQCEGILEELRFLGAVMNDPALESVLKELIPLLEEVVRYSGLSLRCTPR